MIGTCTFWNNQRGYGFVTAQDGTQYFLHISNFERGKTPVLGAYISFELGQPLRQKMQLQAVNAHFATAEEARRANATTAGVNALSQGVRS